MNPDIQELLAFLEKRKEYPEFERWYAALKDIIETAQYNHPLSLMRRYEHWRETVLNAPLP